MSFLILRKNCLFLFFFRILFHRFPLVIVFLSFCFRATSWFEAIFQLSRGFYANPILNSSTLQHSSMLMIFLFPLFFLSFFFMSIISFVYRAHWVVKLTPLFIPNGIRSTLLCPAMCTGWFFDFNDMSTHLALFSVSWLGNFGQCTLIFIFLYVCFLRTLQEHY